jgi:hypothetical protein
MDLGRWNQMIVSLNGGFGYAPAPFFELTNLELANKYYGTKS